MSKRKLAGIIVGCIVVVIVIVVIATRPPTPTYILSVSVNPPEAGSVSPFGGEYESGDQVALTASPASGYTFDYWSGNASGTTCTITITMLDHYSITANFEQIPPGQFSFTISSSFGGVVTTPGEGRFIYDEGTVVNLVAEAEEGYTFVNWTGDVDVITNANNATTTVTMLDHYSITANFAQLQLKTYSKYGFSFEYPKTFSVIEMGLLTSEANDASGVVQVGVENEEIEFFQVGWIKMMPNMVEIGPGGLEGNLKDSLEGGFAAFESGENVASVERGELVEATKAGHLMFYQYYTATSTEGDKVYGIANCFYCDESQKLFSFMTMNDTISAKEDVLEDFQNYLDSFVCH